MHRKTKKTIARVNEVGESSGKNTEVKLAKYFSVLSSRDRSAQSGRWCVQEQRLGELETDIACTKAATKRHASATRGPPTRSWNLPTVTAVNSSPEAFEGTMKSYIDM